MKIKVKGESKEVTEIRTNILERFKDLIFVEEGHKYYLNGVDLPSVSAITHQFEEPFDNEKAAENYAKKHGETPQHWKDEWKFKNLVATTTGSLVHEYGESIAWVRNGHPERITDYCKSKYYKDKNWLIPTRNKERAVLKFWDELPPNLHFVLAEAKVYSNSNPDIEQLKQQYCGTFDLLFYYKHPTDDTKSGLVIFDYKTNGDLYNEFNRSHNKMLYPPFNDFVQEALSNYTLQLSCYQIPLEDMGYKVLGRRIIWLKEDGTYEKIPLKDVTATLRKVL